MGWIENMDASNLADRSLVVPEWKMVAGGEFDSSTADETELKPAKTRLPYFRLNGMVRC